MASIIALTTKPQFGIELFPLADELYCEPVVRLFRGTNTNSKDLLDENTIIKPLEIVEWIRHHLINHPDKYLSATFYRFELQDCTDTTPVSLHIGILAESNEHRKSVIKECHNHSIETRVWSHGNLGKHNFWTSRYGEFDGEVSNKIYERGFIVPTHPLINLEDVDFISEVCNGAE